MSRAIVHSIVLMTALVAATPQARAFPTEGLTPVACKYGDRGTFTDASQYRIYKLHQEVEEYKYFDKNCDGRLDRSERAAIDRHIEQQVALGAEAEFERYRRYRVTVPVPPQRLPNPPKVGGWSSQFVLRDSFDDISIFAGPKDVKLASGASFSYGRDDVAANTAWSAKGVVAYPFSWSAPPVEGRRPAHVPYLVGFAVTPTVSFQRATNSNAGIAKKNDVDVLNSGAGGEVAIGNFIDDTMTHYVRARGGLVSDFEGRTRSWTVVGEYQPLTNWSSGLNLSTPNPLGSLPATFELDAILRANYSRRLGDDIADPIFVSSDSVFRLGPVLALGIAPLQGDDSPVPKWLQRASFSASYSWLDDFAGRRGYSHFSTALSYAFDDSGNVGMKLSYEKGKIEETGQDVALTKVGLSAKF